MSPERDERQRWEAEGRRFAQSLPTNVRHELSDALILGERIDWPDLVDLPFDERGRPPAGFVSGVCRALDEWEAALG